MRSPFNRQGEDKLVPADASALWPIIVDLLLAQGVDISDLPVPDTSQVRALLLKLQDGNPPFVPVTADQVTDIAAERRTMRSVFELGYKGVIGGRVQLGIDVHHMLGGETGGVCRVAR